jgi:RimJ/RimL family protein N-acetyltransferase
MAIPPNLQLIPNPLLPFNTKRLSFRAVRQPEDLPLFLAIHNDQSGFMNSNFTNTSLPSTADATKFMKSVAEDSLLGATIWLQPLQGDEGSERTRNDGATSEDLKSEWGTAIGEVHLSRLPAGAQHHRWTEIGIDILPSFQGNGYGREAIEWALDYAFRRVGLHRVRIRAFGWNAGAVKLYEKVGFKIEGREREALWHEGRWWDGMELGMLEGEWWGMQRDEKGREQPGVEDE